MTTSFQRIRVLSDGRPGHENQSLGLAEALRRRTGAEIECLRLESEDGWLKRLRRACALAPGAEPPQLLIAAGHRTHLPLFLATKKLGARSVVIMKPSLPRRFFDLCLAPWHDLGACHRDSARIVATRGALNRLPEAVPAKTRSAVVLIGGPSKHHRWDGEALAAAIREVVASRPDLAWTIGDSRRTPEGFLDALKVDASAKVTKVPHGQTTPGWLPSVLGAAEEAWVTEDSVSMLFEAVTSGARTGVLPMPVNNPRARTVRAAQDLVASGYARALEDWRRAPSDWKSMPRLHETARCAEIVLKTFFPGSLA